MFNEQLKINASFKERNIFYKFRLKKKKEKQMDTIKFS